MPAQRNPKPILRMIKGVAPGRIYELLPRHVISALINSADRVVSRPLAGDSVRNFHAGVISSDKIVIGRREDCQIVIIDKEKRVSKLHAEINRDRSGYVISNKSRNGTRVNGALIEQPTRLRDGDQINLCEHVFEFRNSIVKLQDDDEGTSTILGRIELGSTSILFPKVGAEDRLPAILEISRDIANTLQIREVLEKTLGSLFKIFPQADRGFVLLKGSDGGELVPTAIRYRRDQGACLTLSKTVLGLVMNEGKAILSTNLPSDPLFAKAGSLHGDAIRTMMCVPLFDQKRATIGMIQIDTPNQKSCFSQDDLDLLVAVAGPVSLAVENARLHDSLIRLITIEASLRNAHAVQLAMLPERRPDLSGYEFWDVYEPALAVGGDYYDYLHLKSQDGSSPVWAVTLGDVAGKGMPAALLMAKLSAEVRVALLTESDPVVAIEKLNAQMCDSRFPERFITLVYVRLDSETNRIVIVNAGHMGPIVRRANGQIEVLAQGQGGLPLAIFENVPYQAIEAEIQVGDVVILYTDGVHEAMNPEQQEFRLNRLQRTIQKAPPGAKAIGESIVQAVRKHAAGCPQSDDIGIVCFGRV